MTSELPSGWEIKALGEALTLQRGFDITKAQQRRGAIPVVSSGGVSSHHDTAAVAGPGVVIGRKGTLGKVFYFAGDYWPHDTTLWVKDFHGNDPRFAYYFLKTLDVLRLDVGSANPTLNRNHVHALEVLWPPLRDQKAIAKVLSALDHKIESNRRAGSVLAELISAMFRHRMVEQARDDWTTSDLTAIARFVNGRAFTKDANGLGRPILRIKELSSGLSDATLYSDIEANDDNTAHHYDLLFAWSGSLDLYRWHGPESLINQHIFKVLPLDEFPAWFVAGWVREHMPEFQRIAKDKATTMGHIKREHLTHAAVRIPPRALLSELDAALSPLDAQIGALAAETITLTALRDALLPKLISSELRVPDTVQPDDAIGLAREGIAA
jgi:type I restriction enzyme S subunit